MQVHLTVSSSVLPGLPSCAQQLLNNILLVIIVAHVLLTIQPPPPPLPELGQLRVQMLPACSAGPIVGCGGCGCGAGRRRGCVRANEGSWKCDGYGNGGSGTRMRQRGDTCISFLLPRYLHSSPSYSPLLLPSFLPPSVNRGVLNLEEFRTHTKFV
jgi:hypothetical protein